MKIMVPVAGNLIIDTATAVGGSAWSTGSIGIKTTTVTNPILVKPGFLWACYQANGASNLIQCVHTPQINPGGTTSTYNIRGASKAGTYWKFTESCTSTWRFCLDRCWTISSFGAIRMIISETYQTSSNGGTANLTLSNTTIHVSQGPKFSDYWGTTAPDPWVDYSIIQFANTSPTLSIVQMEQGIAPLNAGSILARANGNVFQSYVLGGGVTPSIVNLSNPTHVNFSTCANNILITTSPYAGGIQQLPRFRNTTNFGVTQLADGLGDPSAHLGMVSGINFVMAANTLYYSPFLVSRSKNYSKATIYVVTASTAGIARVGLYHDDGTGSRTINSRLGKCCNLFYRNHRIKNIYIISTCLSIYRLVLASYYLHKNTYNWWSHIRMINPGNPHSGQHFLSQKKHLHGARYHKMGWLLVVLLWKQIMSVLRYYYNDNNKRNMCHIFNWRNRFITIAINF